MTPSVNQHTAPPPGNMPRNRQTYILLGIALLIVAAVVFSPTGGSPPSSAVPKQPPVTGPTKSEIEQYGKQLQGEEARLRRAQLEAAQARNALQQEVGPAPLAGGTPANELRPAYQPPAEPPKSTFEQEKERREYASLFASNVALSLAASTAATHSATPGAQETSPSPSLSNASAPPAKPQLYVLLEGNVIETALTNRLDGSFTGPVNCQVTTDVWSRDHQHLLIPQGTRILGEAQRVAQQDQERLAIVFHRLIMPDGYSVDLNRLAGLDQQGATAVKDQVNHHYLSTFATSVLLGVISGFAISGTGAGYNATGADAYRQGVASQLSQSSARILDRQLSRLPTITIREGQRIKVYIAKDLELPDVKDHGKEVL